MVLKSLLSPPLAPTSPPLLPPLTLNGQSGIICYRRLITSLRSCNNKLRICLHERYEGGGGGSREGVEDVGGEWDSHLK